MENKLSIPRSIFIIIVMSVAIFAILRLFSSLKMIMSVKTEQPIETQIFFDKGEGFTEEHSIKKFVNPSSEFKSVIFKLPKNVNEIRIDPMSASGLTINIEYIRLKFFFVKQRSYWTGLSLSNDFRSANDITNYQIIDNVLFLESTGPDPQISFNGDWNELTGTFKFKASIIIFAVSIIFASIIYFFIILSQLTKMKKKSKTQSE